MKDGVVKKIMSKTNRLYPDYTKLILENMYSLLSLPDISTFIKDNYLYYFKSNLMNKWIPFCIVNAKERRSIESVMRSNVFGRKVFRSIDKTVDEEIINNPSYIEKNKAEIIDLIKRNMIIPSVEVLYWSIEVAGKYHFGNDYGFYERYQKHLNEKLSNQITKMREDGINYLEMNNDYGIPYNIGVGKLIPRNIHGQVKNTRINSPSSLIPR